MVEQAQMTSAKAEILARVRAVDGTERPTIARSYRRSGDLAPGERVRRFVARLEEYTATVREIGNADLRTAVAHVCRHHSIVRLGVAPAFPADWRPSTIDVIEDHGLSPHELDKLDGAATGCTIAIAETGTIVLTGDKAEGRRALTLVPDVHICVIRINQIVELLPEAIRALDRAGQGRNPLTMISGPSATSDIELSRVDGVHGPRTLVAIIAGSE